MNVSATCCGMTRPSSERERLVLGIHRPGFHRTGDRPDYRRLSLTDDSLAVDVPTAPPLQAVPVSLLLSARIPADTADANSATDFRILLFRRIDRKMSEKRCNRPA